MLMALGCDYRIVGNSEGNIRLVWLTIDLNEERSKYAAFRCHFMVISRNLP